MVRVRGAARPGFAGAKQASPAFAACGGGAAPRTLPLQKRCKGSRGRPAEPGKIRQFILSNYYNAAAPEKQRNRRFCNRIVKMHRPQPPAKSPPPPPCIKSAIIRPLAPQPRPLQKLRPPTTNPRKKIPAICAGSLVPLQQRRKDGASRRHQPPQKIPAICAGSLVPLQRRRKDGASRRLSPRKTQQG